ncbi:hypothetical protein HPB49_004892 [Dermacentor silvarum]|uniref:Uncharacterized protein n=1 Tax=Dermacentor silvarum TaxID=543639 RepID=A0ACB8C257_DERSI|nr:hypothetical protein HPB49_004892 [Dermacentor silvarum]
MHITDGDSGYPLEPWRLTPVAGHRSPPSPEAEYKVHTAMRAVVERCIGILKERYRCLQKYRALHHEPGRAGHIVAACVTLHNICLAAGEPVLSDEEVDDSDGIDTDDEQQPQQSTPTVPLSTPSTAQSVSQQVRRMLFSKGKALRDSKLQLYQQGRPQRISYLNRVRRRFRRLRAT